MVDLEVAKRELDRTRAREAFADRWMRIWRRLAIWNAAVAFAFALLLLLAVTR